MLAKVLRVYDWMSDMQSPLASESFPPSEGPGYPPSCIPKVRFAGATRNASLGLWASELHIYQVSERSYRRATHPWPSHLLLTLCNISCCRPSGLAKLSYKSFFSSHSKLSTCLGHINCNELTSPLKKSQTGSRCSKAPALTSLSF
jgi:hypothetical protein